MRLAAYPGWSWFDATNRYREAAGMPPLAAEAVPAPLAGQPAADRSAAGGDLPTPGGEPLTELVQALRAGRCAGCPHPLADHFAPFPASSGRIESVCGAVGCGCATLQRGDAVG